MIWELFVPPDHEITIRHEPIHNPREHLLLERGREVGKGQITAENEIKVSRWRLRPDILMQETQTLTMARLDAKARPDPIEGLSYEMRRQFAQACRRNASLPCTREHDLVDLRGDDDQRDVGAEPRDFDIP